MEFRQKYPREPSGQVDSETMNERSEIASKAGEILDIMVYEDEQEEINEKGCGIHWGLSSVLPPLELFRASENVNILTLLYEGRKVHAIEILEADVDYAVMASWRRLQEIVGEDLKSEIRFLETVKDFRQKYPRASPEHFGEETSERRMQIISNVNKIFEDL